MAKVSPKPGAVASIAPIVTHVAKSGSIIAGTPAATTMRNLLKRRGATAAGAEAVIRMVKVWDVTPKTHVSAARRRVMEHNDYARAAYMVNAARRVSRTMQELKSQGVDPKLIATKASQRERPYYRLHVAAHVNSEVLHKNPLYCSSRMCAT